MQFGKLHSTQMIVLSTAGGHNLKETVRKIMRKLGDNGLWSQYSWTGRKGKEPFAKMAISRIIIREYFFTKID